MKKNVMIILLVLFMQAIFAKAYKVQVFNSVDRENLVEVETEDGIVIPLESGETFVEDTDIIKARGKGYIIIYLENGKKKIFRNGTKLLKDLISN